MDRPGVTISEGRLHQAIALYLRNGQTVEEYTNYHAYGRQEEEVNPHFRFVYTTIPFASQDQIVIYDRSTPYRP